MWELRFRTTKENWDLIDLVISKMGSIAVTTSCGDTDLYDNPASESERGVWSKFQVSVLFSDWSKFKDTRRALNEILEFPETLKARKIDNDTDWGTEWKRRWTPKTLKSGLCIYPSWLGPPEDKLISLQLDPGRAFGTGAHETTEMCLDYLGECSGLDGLKVVDYGSGSGILSLAAVALGCSDVVATDVDPDALEITQKNVDSNLFQEQISVLTTDSLKNYKADIVVANILLDALIELRSIFSNMVQTGGHLVVSGITISQISILVSAYENYFDTDRVDSKGEWALIIFNRR